MIPMVVVVMVDSLQHPELTHHNHQHMSLLQVGGLVVVVVVGGGERGEEWVG